MKTKLLIASALILLASNSMAMKITNGKLIGHKEWFSKNANGSFPEKTYLKPLNAKTLPYSYNPKSHDDNKNIISNSTKIGDMQINKTGESITFSSYNNVFVYNNDNKQKLYTIHTSLCSYQDEQHEPFCANAEDQILLDPHGMAGMMRNPELIIPLQTGLHQIVLITSVDNDDNTFMSSADSALTVNP